MNQNKWKLKDNATLSFYDASTKSLAAAHNNNKKKNMGKRSLFLDLAVVYKTM